MLLRSALLVVLALPSTLSRVMPPAPTVVVTGVVRDGQSKLPLVGTAIVLRVDGTMVPSSAVLTDATGRYTVRFTREARWKQVAIVARKIGYTPQTQLVPANDSAPVIDITLMPQMLELSQIVVTGMSGRSAPATAGANVSRQEREQYGHYSENPFLDARRRPLSTFAIDVDRASYTNVRRMLNEGRRPPHDAVRIEELVNYFAYDYEAPARTGDPLLVTTETHAAPWQPSHRLVRIAMQAQRIPVENLPPSNLVFLIDVSGSMSEPNKLPLVTRSLRLLTEALRPSDRVAIVVYAGAAGAVLPSTPGDQKTTIVNALDALRAGGSTNGGDGIRLAYRIAREHFLPDGENRVILATDGDFNVGTSSMGELVELIETERKSNIRLTVLGFGTGNLQDHTMEQLADKGNGNYAYIDNLAEANKALVREMGGTLHTLAKDVKLQVEFNPARVQSYRLIGYENRLLQDEDFNDDTKDAGELGAGHSVTALYDVVLVGDTGVRTGTVDSLRYSRGGTVAPSAQRSDELAFVKVRWQSPRGGRSVLRSVTVRESEGPPSTDYTFASAVAGFGLLLRDSPHRGAITWRDVQRLAEQGLGRDRDGDRVAFVRLVGQAERAAPATASRGGDR